MKAFNLERNPTLKQTKQTSQITLNGQVATTPTITGNYGDRYLTINYFKLLEVFYLDFSDYGISRKTLQNLGFAENTSDRILKRLLRLNYIKVIAKNVGPNKCMKYYKITEEGAVHFESFEKKIVYAKK